MNVAYLGWCPTQTAYSAYSIVHIHRLKCLNHLLTNQQSPPQTHLQDKHSSVCSAAHFSVCVFARQCIFIWKNTTRSLLALRTSTRTHARAHTHTHTHTQTRTHTHKPRTHAARPLSQSEDVFSAVFLPSGEHQSLEIHCSCVCVCICVCVFSFQLA